VPEQPLKQEYLQKEEAEEILRFLRKMYPGDAITMTQPNLFYSAVHRPYQQACYGDTEPSLAEHAASQMMAFATNHSLNNANKRMAIIAAYFVLKKNGYTFKKWKRLYKSFAPIVEKIIRYKEKHYNFGFLCLSIGFLMDEENTLPIESFEYKLIRAKNRKQNRRKRKRESRKRK
jgi:death-on-curing family protein